MMLGVVTHEGSIFGVGIIAIAKRLDDVVHPTLLESESGAEEDGFGGSHGCSGWMVARRRLSSDFPVNDEPGMG